MSIDITGGILTPGTKFEVISAAKNGHITNGTTGFICTTCNVSNAQINSSSYVDYVCMVTKIGKNGKRRLERTPMSLATLSFTGDNSVVTYINSELLLGGYPKGVAVENTFSLLEMSSYDFLAWALAYGYYLSTLSKSFCYKNLNLSNAVIMPTDKNNFVVLASGSRVTNHYSEDPEGTLATYTSQNARITIINQIREMEARTSKIALYNSLKSIEHHRQTLDRQVELTNNVKLDKQDIDEVYSFMDWHHNSLNGIEESIKTTILDNGMPLVTNEPKMYVHKTHTATL